MTDQIATSVRHIVVHYHLFRNGGHVIDRILEKNFGDNLIHLNSRNPDGTVTGSDLLRCVREHREVKAVSSLHLRPPRPQVEDFVFFDIFFIRHPLDRICAMYDGLRNRNCSGSLAEIAKKDLGYFTGELLADYPHLINNAQVNYLANGGIYFRPPKNSDLQKAVDMLEQAALPGVTHRIGISLAMAESYFRPAFPTIDFSYVSPTPRLPDDALQARVERVKAACSPVTYDKLLEMNQLDLELVRLAEEELCRRFRLLPNPEERLAHFLGRCRAIAEYFLEFDDVNGSDN